MKRKRKLLKWFIIGATTFLLLAVVMIIGIFQLLEAEKTSLPTPSSTVQMREQFLGEIGESAREIAAKHDLYASVMIAQASLESHFGTSGLGSHPHNNLYGIKGAYNGDSVKFDTLEDDGKGNMKTVKADFRKYPDYRASLEDYADLLQNGTSWNKNIYAKTFKSNAPTYKEATEALMGTYASDSSYAGKLNALIEQYDLTAYDHDVYEKKITVEFFENVEDISEKYGVSQTLIRQWNHLKTNELKKDDELILYVQQ